MASSLGSHSAAAGRYYYSLLLLALLIVVLVLTPAVAAFQTAYNNDPRTCFIVPLLSSVDHLIIRNGFLQQRQMSLFQSASWEQQSPQQEEQEEDSKQTKINREVDLIPQEGGQLENRGSTTTNQFLISRWNLLQRIMISTVTISNSLFLQTIEQSAVAYEIGGQGGEHTPPQKQGDNMSVYERYSSNTQLLFEINDPDTYSGLVYVPPSNNNNKTKKFPVLFVIHGAGENVLDTWNLANIQGEHAGLAPSLLASNQAPRALYENFVVIAPYSKGKTSFYNEPRSKLLQFMNFSLSQDGGGRQGIDLDKVDLDCQCLFGFSDGATLGVELMTTRKFVAGVFCAYGFTGKLPSLALERLKGLPMWIFHSVDDAIFPIKCSDQLVRDLRFVNGDKKDIIRYTRLDQDPRVLQQGLKSTSPALRGHMVGMIMASKDIEVYEWLLSITSAKVS